MIGLWSTLAMAGPQWSPPPIQDLLAYPADVALVHGRCGATQVRTVFDPTRRTTREEYEVEWTELEVLTPIRGEIGSSVRVPLDDCMEGQQVIVGIRPDPVLSELYALADASAIIHETVEGGIGSHEYGFVDDHGRFQARPRALEDSSYAFMLGEPPHTWSDVLEAVQPQVDERRPRRLQPIQKAADRLRDLVASSPTGDPWGTSTATWNVEEGLHRLRWTSRPRDIAPIFLDASRWDQFDSSWLPHEISPDATAITHLSGAPCEERVWCGLLVEFDDGELVRITLSLAPHAASMNDPGDRPVHEAAAQLTKRMGLPEDAASGDWTRMGRRFVRVFRHDGVHAITVARSRRHRAEPQR